MIDSFIERLKMDEIPKDIKNARLEPITLGYGQDPPAGVINPDYKEQPSNPRKCESCGKIHDLIVENWMTGERIEELSKCRDCFFATAFSYNREVK
jgi:hypothetical protein